MDRCLGPQNPREGGADGVEPGQTYTYRMTVPERAGPSQGDGDSIAWLYTSDVQHSADANTGLVRRTQA